MKQTISAAKLQLKLKWSRHPGFSWGLSTRTAKFGKIELHLPPAQFALARLKATSTFIVCRRDIQKAGDPQLYGPDV